MRYEYLWQNQKMEGSRYDFFFSRSFVSEVVFLGFGSGNAKFDSCLKDERPMAMYSALAEIETIINPSFPDKIGMYLAIGLPDFLDILSVPFNLSPIKDCHTAAYAMIAKCARKAKR